MTTKTRGKHAAAPAVKPATEIFEMDERFAAIFDELSEVQLARKAAQDREKELKELIMAEVPEEQDKGVTFALRVANAIRGKVTVRTRTGVEHALDPRDDGVGLDARLGAVRVDLREDRADRVHHEQEHVGRRLVHLALAVAQLDEEALTDVRHRLELVEREEPARALDRVDRAEDRAEQLA